MKLDIIIPTYNEEDNIIELHKILTKEFKNINYTLIFVDDGSKDKTLENLDTIYNNDKKHVKVISFSRNFGKDAAIYAGLKNSHAEYSCIIDADLQQNPKYITNMLNFLENNPEYDEVAMVNDYSNENKISGFLKKRFYKIISKLSEQNFEVGASDFRMFRKYVVEAINDMSEKNRFSKGIFSWIGFNIHYMNYEVEERHAGTSKFNFRRQISYAIDGITNFSTKPLRIATILGSIISLVAFIYFIIIIIQTIIFGKDIPGYASMMCMILVLGGIQILALGIIGEYLAKSYIETKNRPVYITKVKKGFDDDIL